MFRFFLWIFLSGGPKQARRQEGGFEGVRSNPPFDLHKILYTLLNILSVLQFESGPLGSLPLRITTVQTSLVGAMLVCASAETA